MGKVNTTLTDLLESVPGLSQYNNSNDQILFSENSPAQHFLRFFLQITRNQTYEEKQIRLINNFSPVHN